MRLDLTRIRAAQERYEKVYQPGAFAAGSEDFRLVAPVALAFDIFKDKQQFRLIGTARTRLELTCSRCLEGFEWPVDAPFDLRYQPHTASAAPGHLPEREIAEDDLSTAFYDNDEIDLEQLMREQFYLSLPMKPLCQDECRGLCPLCGINRNRATCACKAEWEDPRLAALKALRDQRNAH